MNNNQTINNFEIFNQIDQLQEYWRNNDKNYHIIISYLRPFMGTIGHDFPIDLWPELLHIYYNLIKSILNDLTLVSSDSDGVLIRQTLH